MFCICVPRGHRATTTVKPQPPARVPRTRERCHWPARYLRRDLWPASSSADTRGASGSDSRIASSPKRATRHAPPAPVIMVHDPSVGAGRENRSSCAGRNTEQRDLHTGGHSELAARRSGDRGRGSLGRRWINPQYYRNIAIVRLSCSSLCSVRWAVGRQLAGRLHRLQQRTVTVRVALAGPGVRSLFRVMFGRVLRGARGYLQEETSAHGRLKCVRYWYQVSCAVDDTAHPRPEVQTYMRRWLTWQCAVHNRVFVVSQYQRGRHCYPDFVTRTGHSSTTITMSDGNRGWLDGWEKDSGSRGRKGGVDNRRHR